VFVGFLERVRREGLANRRRKALLCSKSKSKKIENMEIIEKNNSGKLGVLGAVLLAAGLALLGWSLLALPPAPAYGFPWEFTLAVAAFLPIAAGGYCLGTLANRRRDPSYRYGSDRHNGGLIPFALLVIIAGVLLLGFNSGVLAGEWKHIFFSLQMLLMVGAMAEYARGRITGASVMLAVGGFFIIRRLAPLYPDIAASGAADSWWPVLLIIAGVLILGSILFKPRGGWYNRCHHGRGDCKGKNWNGAESRASGVIDTEVVFGGCEQVYLDPVFRGGKISTVFGGVKLDLRRTTLPEGDTYLKIESVFGGIEIDTPEEWAIEIRSESIFGGFVDKRLPPIGGGYDEGRKLIIRASCVFGGGEIK
jgi:hypothetical protein